MKRKATPDWSPRFEHGFSQLVDWFFKLHEIAAKAEEKLTHLRSLYEPYVTGVARNLQLTLPPWLRSEKRKDNWQGGPWDQAIQARGLGGIRTKEPVEQVPEMEEHF